MSTGPGTVNCTCKPPLAGDGYSCYGIIPVQAESKTELQEFTTLIKVCVCEFGYLIN